ncbi:MAG: PKD domain-containing protein [Cytophagales bacterium]|nr:PKD domain-containing protein [Cytophagales bacterium]
MKTITLTKRLLMLTLVIGILGVTSCSDDEPSVDAPNAAFTSAADGLTVTFTDGSVGADTYSWDFGDGNSSTDASPTHTYAEGGTYTVALTVTNAGGSDTESEDITVEAPFASNLVGTWRVATEEAALAVGPSPGSADWWFLPAGDLEARACYLDDDYVFGADGTFSVNQGDQTWVEAWQEGVDADGCGAGVAPFDGSGSYTFSATSSEITVTGEGAFIGLAKVTNAGELATENVRNDVPLPASVTYNIAEFAADGNSMTLQIDANGVHWQYRLVKTN